MRLLLCSAVLSFLPLGGCSLFSTQVVQPMQPVREYRARGFDWGGVRRVLLLPLVNETAFPHAAVELRHALANEFQALGRFEVVVAPDDVCEHLAHEVRLGGRFNEQATIELARLFRADVLVFGTLGAYSPYVPQRIGLTLQVVSPFDAVVVASVDGLWDTSQKSVANQAAAFYREPPPPPATHALVALGEIAFGVMAKGNLPPQEPAVNSELVRDSPRLFQRFVSHQAVGALTR